MMALERERGAMDAINIGLVGMGTVGGGVVKILQSKLQTFRTVLGLPLCLKRVADKNSARFAELGLTPEQCTTSAQDILDDASIHIVIELVGGTGFARTLVLDALRRGKHVITANKALIAEHGPELFEAAQANKVSIFFEASVGGGMPSIKTIRESMVGNSVRSIKSIINGTCNYILSQMSANGQEFDDALKAAQAKGYAEADPTLDIGGGDTGHKVAIMASLAYGGYVPYEDIAIEGITTITRDDIAFARELGYVIKLLGIIKRDAHGGIEVRVHPAMLKKSHILASVSNEFNAVLIDGDAVGDILLYGKGAGEMPTASAVISDIVDCARDIKAGSTQRIPGSFYTLDHKLPLKPITGIRSRYYLRFSVVDQPGVLAKIVSALGRCAISIASVMQQEGSDPTHVPVLLLTHQAVESNVRAAIAEIEKLDIIKAPTQIIRIEE
jgi:homoserine dehydrogenase